MGTGLSRSRSNFRKHAFLRGGGLEGKNSLQRFAHFVFADTEGDGIFLADGFAAQSQAQLIEEKFLEDQALLRGRAKQIERLQRFFCRREMRVD